MSKNFDITTRGVVIARAQSGEGSARIFIYTESAGLLGVLAKSAREERSKLRPHLQVGTYGSFTLVKGIRDWRVTGAVDTENSYFQLRGAPRTQAASARVVGVVRQLVHGEEKNQELFDALWAFLHALPHFTEDEVKTGEYLAVIRILSALGYVPPESVVPHLLEASYAGKILDAVKPFEKQLVKTINNALLASNLS